MKTTTSPVVTIYPAEVRFEIAEQEWSPNLRAADFLNIPDVDVVCVEHEFGIFGGPAGSHVLALLRELQMPIVTTLHSATSFANVPLDELQAAMK